MDSLLKNAIPYSKFVANNCKFECNHFDRSGDLDSFVKKVKKLGVQYVLVEMDGPEYSTGGLYLKIFDSVDIKLLILIVKEMPDECDIVRDPDNDWLRIWWD